MEDITKEELRQKLETLVNTETDSIANRWLTADEFSKITDDQKNCIKNIETKNTDKESFVKLKFQSKSKAMSTLKKMKS